MAGWPPPPLPSTPLGTGDAPSLIHHSFPLTPQPSPLNLQFPTLTPQPSSLIPQSSSLRLRFPAHGSVESRLQSTVIRTSRGRKRWPGLCLCRLGLLDVNSALPTDAELVMHLVAAFLDNRFRYTKSHPLWSIGSSERLWMISDRLLSLRLNECPPCCPLR